MHFSAVARRGTMIVREDTLKQTVSAYLVDRIRSTKNIEVLTNVEGTALIGDKFLEAIKLRNGKTRDEQTVKTHWRFVGSGGAPHTECALHADLYPHQARSHLPTPHFT